MKARYKIVDDEKFVRDNFEKLVNKYGGSTIVVANNEIFTEKNAVEVAYKKYPEITPYVLTLPQPEFFSHHFLL